MYVKRTMSKLFRSLAKSPLMAQLRHILETTPIIHQFVSKLPPLGLLLFSVYIGCDANSIILDCLFIIITCVILAVVFYYAQDLLLYYPKEPSTARIFVPSPAHYGNMNYENITITTKDGTLIHAFFIKHDRSSDKPTIIMYHGNAGNIGNRVPNAYRLVTECGTNVLLMEYRGYGLSGGEISEAGLYDDAVSAVKYVKSRGDIDPNRIVVHGRSLGGAVAINVALHSQCSELHAVIIENSFTSLPAIAKRVLNIPVIRVIPDWCYKNKYYSLEKIVDVKQPTLFLSGRSDSLIPPRHMDALYMASGSVKKEMSSFPNGTHNETWTEPGYFFAIRNFLQRL